MRDYLLQLLQRDSDVRMAEPRGDKYIVVNFWDGEETLITVENFY